MNRLIPKSWFPKRNWEANHFTDTYSIATVDAYKTSTKERTLLSIIGIGVLLVLAVFASSGVPKPLFLLGVGIVVITSIIYFVQKFGDGVAGIKHHGIMFDSAMARGLFGWALGIFITGFYILLYWYPATLENMIRALDSISYALRGQESNQWFLYGFFYTIAILVMGVRMFLKYRHNRYHQIRTLSVSFFQLAFAFLIPAFLMKLNKPEFYFTYFWPLKYDYLFPGSVSWLMSDSYALGTFMVFWGLFMSTIGTVVLTYFYGKRWYCSWVCGCGGLAETAGDSFRHLSDKSMTAWKIERYLIHSVLVFIVLVTALLWINDLYYGEILKEFTFGMKKTYGFLIGSMFSGVIGTGFYPILGNRSWCRFGCPMAAYLGILQKFFSRFRITTNGNQCISCGNCSAYCEMGIDVKSYAQRQENIVRSSCVGCGVCAAVCPRGVLKLENLVTHKNKTKTNNNPFVKA